MMAGSALSEGAPVDLLAQCFCATRAHASVHRRSPGPGIVGFLQVCACDDRDGKNTGAIPVAFDDVVENR
jgi:hypothetical protein